MGGYLSQLGRRDIDVLDFGCGWGGETLWLASQVRSAVGIDVNEGAIAQARQALRLHPELRCEFMCSEGGRLPLANQSIDAVFSTDTLEHVLDLDVAFSEIHRVLRPGGVFISKFGPLFYSPQGYHLYWACQVPWAHVLCGLHPILELRQLRSGEISQSRSWQDTGLNCKRFRDYVKAVRRTPFEVVRFERIAVRGLQVAARLPVVGDYLTFGVDAFLRRPSEPGDADESQPAQMTTSGRLAS